MSSSLSRFVRDVADVSRRAAHKAVIKGKVTVNGIKCTNPALPLARTDQVTMEGILLVCCCTCLAHAALSHSAAAHAARAHSATAD